MAVESHGCVSVKMRTGGSGVAEAADRSWS